MKMSESILNIFNPLKTFVRFRHPRYFRAPGGIRYPGGIVYYPRTPDHQDPEYTPSKLFRVERVKPVKNNAWWLKGILRAFKIDEEERVAIVKNIPENNARLWKIKHLVKITPIVFPYGEPTADDINHTILKENGECIVTKNISPDVKCIESREQYERDPKRMDNETYKKDSRQKWLEPWSGGF